MEKVERKLQIAYAEKFKESAYTNEEVSAFYFYWTPTEGPFCLIPSLSDDKPSTYKLTFFSNNPV
jgi:hypothetical protein